MKKFREISKKNSHTRSYSMVLREKGQSDILMKSQTVCMHSNSFGKKGQYARTNCINFFNKTYQNNLCSLAL